MKVAVIGAGMWGKNLVNNFAEMGVLAAVADVMESNRIAVAEKHPGVFLFNDADSLFACAEVDAVAIATPPHTHCALALTAMEKGLDVFVEKPMTLNLIEAEKMVASAEENGRILMVGHLLMYQPAITFIKDYLDSGKLGQVYTLYQRRSKLGRVRKVENVLWSFGVHDVAVLLYLVGEDPIEVKSFGHAGVTTGIEDDVHLHLAFPSGVKANLHNSWLWPRVERELIITGENGILVFDELNSRVLLHHKTVDKDSADHSDRGEVCVFEGSSQPLRLELEHFLECCSERVIPLSSASNGLSCVKVLKKAEDY